MTLGSIIALFGAMAVLAFVPSVSVLAVSARSAASGFIHGVFTTMGIVVGDIVFIVVAIFGLSVLAEAMGSLFVVIKYLGGAYLVWLGIRLWRSGSQTAGNEGVVESSLLSSFLTGLSITLGDQKAILFYLGFLPAFLDLSEMTYVDTLIVIATAIVAVGGVKLGYAYVANRIGSLFGPKTNRVIGISAGGVMVAVGVYVMVKA